MLKRQEVTMATARLNMSDLQSDNVKMSVDELRIGLERLRTMSHDELRQVILQRVELLQSVLREREQRRVALNTAQMASKILDLRRDRAVELQRHVNVGSAVAAAVATITLFVTFM
jgi:hypothetical protein